MLQNIENYGHLNVYPDSSQSDQQALSDIFYTCLATKNIELGGSYNLSITLATLVVELSHIFARETRE